MITGQIFWGYIFLASFRSFTFVFQNCFIIKFVYRSTNILLSTLSTNAQQWTKVNQFLCLKKNE
jgi:hypothetical protein